MYDLWLDEGIHICCKQTAVLLQTPVGTCSCNVYLVRVLGRPRIVYYKPLTVWWDCQIVHEVTCPTIQIYFVIPKSGAAHINFVLKITGL